MRCVIGVATLCLFVGVAYSAADSNYHSHPGPHNGSHHGQRHNHSESLPFDGEEHHHGHNGSHHGPGPHNGSHPHPGPGPHNGSHHGHHRNHSVSLPFDGEKQVNKDYKDNHQLSDGESVDPEKLSFVSGSHQHAERHHRGENKLAFVAVCSSALTLVVVLCVVSLRRWWWYRLQTYQSVKTVDTA
ncbi:membrane-associated protein, putative [Bodo saltans]|uniref:Membrane-associated protein, putative n=1 Tax=Bodo saltans TaxID=75058 RepID=A0A0S4J354_BODSA|nr:membrane-associated protein, putative [Bodo saltans]|eukprot:CUG85723.1 membrane-associated protein, putative [Bodo saltans]